MEEPGTACLEVQYTTSENHSSGVCTTCAVHQNICIKEFSDLEIVQSSKSLLKIIYNYIQHKLLVIKNVLNARFSVWIPLYYMAEPDFTRYNMFLDQHLY